MLVGEDDDGADVLVEAISDQPGYQVMIMSVMTLVLETGRRVRPDGLIR